MSTQPKTDYAIIVEEVTKLIDAPCQVPDAATRAYMIARAALLAIAYMRSFEDAAGRAYALGDEFSTRVAK